MKLKQLKEKLKEESLDGCLLFSEDANFRYYVQNQECSGVLYIPARGKPSLFLHALEKLEHDFYVKRYASMDDVKEYLQEKDVGKVAYNSSEVTVKDYNKLKNYLKLKDFSEELASLREVKTEEEIQCLTKAAEISDEIMEDVIDNFEFTTEGEIKRYIKKQMAERGLEQSFEPTVASGSGAAVPHYLGEKELEEGFLVIDLGVKYKGYCGDITRTLYYGTPSDEEKALYDKVLKVEQDCIDLCRTGVEIEEVFEHAYKELGKKLKHGLGHGLGLEVHEKPKISQGSEGEMKENTVFTIEPGWYDQEKGIGIRIEDDILLKDGKPIYLTETSRELKTV